MYCSNHTTSASHKENFELVEVVRIIDCCNIQKS